MILHSLKKKLRTIETTKVPKIPEEKLNINSQFVIPKSMNKVSFSDE